MGPQLAVVPSTAPPVVGLTDKVVYLSVVGVARENNFVLNGSVGDIYPKHPAVTISTPTSGRKNSVVKNLCDISPQAVVL